VGDQVSVPRRVLGWFAPAPLMATGTADGRRWVVEIPSHFVPPLGAARELVAAGKRIATTNPPPGTGRFVMRWTGATWIAGDRADVAAFSEKRPYAPELLNPEGRVRVEVPDFEGPPYATPEEAMAARRAYCEEHGDAIPTVPGALAGAPDLISVRPKMVKGPGDCLASALAGELSCDLDAGHGPPHYDAEYRVCFEAG
jgi:hypothetical protein